MLILLILSQDSFSPYVSHTGTSYYVSHSFIRTLSLSHLDISRSFHSAVRANFDLLSLHHGVPGPDLPIQRGYEWNSSFPAGSLAHTTSSSTWLAPSSTGVPWPDALCHGDPSTLLEPIRNTASAAYVSIVPNTPTMDFTYGTFSAHAASELTDTSQQR